MEVDTWTDKDGCTAVSMMDPQSHATDALSNGGCAGTVSQEFMFSPHALGLLATSTFCIVEKIVLMGLACVHCRFLFYSHSKNNMARVKLHEADA